MTTTSEQNKSDALKSVMSSPWGGMFIIRRRRGKNKKPKRDIINLSQLVTSATITLREEGLSEFTAVCINPKNKLFKKIKQFDRRVIYGGRNAGSSDGHQILTVYVDKVPFDLDRAGDPIVISGYCTLYRAAMRFFDPYLPQYKNFANSTPDVILEYLASDSALGGYQIEDVLIEPLAKGVKDRWAAAQASNVDAALSDTTPNETADDTLSSNPTTVEIANYMAEKFEAIGVPARYAIASSLVETTTLNPDALQGVGDYAVGLFQTFPRGAGGGVGRFQYREELNKAWNQQFKVTGYKPTTDYPATHQIAHATAWWNIADKPARTDEAGWLNAVSNRIQKPGDRSGYIEKMRAQLPTADTLLNNFTTPYSGAGDSGSSTLNPTYSSDDQNTLSTGEGLVSSVLNHTYIEFARPQDESAVRQNYIDARVLVGWLLLASAQERNKKMILSNVFRGDDSDSLHSQGKAADIGTWNGVWLGAQAGDPEAQEAVRRMAEVLGRQTGLMTPNELIGNVDVSGIPAYFRDSAEHDDHFHMGYGTIGGDFIASDSPQAQDAAAAADTEINSIFGDRAVTEISSGYFADPWELDSYKVKYENLDDESVISYMNKVASWGWYKITTNGFGQFVARVPQYLGDPTYIVREMDIMHYNPIPWSVRELHTHVYTKIDFSPYQFTDLEQARNAFTVFLGASTVYDQINWDYLLNDEFFAPYREELQTAMDQAKAEGRDTDINSISADDPAVKAIETVLNRTCGERPLLPIIEERELRSKEQAQLSADYHFKEQWFNRYRAQMQCTFLPNLRPQHNVYIPYKGYDYYVTEVTHTMFDSWTTSVSMVAGRKHVRDEAQSSESN